MPEEIIRLNVGGVSFTTYQSTLKNKSGWFRKKLGAEEEMFVGRDGTHFRVILNYMRDGVIRLPNNKRIVEEIQREAIFYEMAELIGLCVLKLIEMY